MIARVATVVCLLAALASSAPQPSASPAAVLRYQCANASCAAADCSASDAIPTDRCLVIVNDVPSSSRRISCRNDTSAPGASNAVTITVFGSATNCSGPSEASVFPADKCFANDFLGFFAYSC